MFTDRSNLIQSIAAAGCETVDLTHKLHAGIPTWPGHPRFCQEVVESFEAGDGARCCSIAFSEHSGTHFDAPGHFVDDPVRGWGIDQVPTKRFISRAVLIDCRSFNESVVTVDHIRAWESTNVEIQPGDFVIFRFGWAELWDQPTKFLVGWPGIGECAALYLVSRGINAACTDCLSIDVCNSKEFPAHRALLGAGILIGENFKLDQELPASFTIGAFPLPINNGSGSPARVLAWV